MPDLRARIAALCDMSETGAERALAEAISHADKGELSALATELIKRGPATSIGAYALVRTMNRLAADLRQSTLGNESISTETLTRAALASGESQTRLNALALLDFRASCGMFTDCLIPNLSHPSPAVREAVAAWLLRVALLIWRRRHHPTKQDVADLDRATADACLSYPDHRQDDILLAACLLSQSLGPTRTPKLQAWIADDTHAGHMASRGTLKRLNRTQLARTIFEWLGTKRLAPQALTHLNELARSETHLPHVLSSSHLALLPTQRRRLHELNPRRPAVVDRKLGFTTSTNESPLHTPALARWIRSIPMADEADRINRLADAQVCPDTATRLAAAHHLGRIAIALARHTAPDPEIASVLTKALFGFCHDPDSRVAELAFLCLHTNRNQATFAATAVNSLRWESCHPAIRRLASALAEDRTDFETLWQIWTDTSLTLTIRSARCRSLAMTQHPNELADALRGQLAPHHSPANLLAAMQLISVIDRVAAFELELLTLTQHTDTRVIATAVRLLACLARESHSCSQAIATLLQHPDPRVCANAIESLDPPLLSTPVIARLLTTMSSSPDTHNRARANAVCRLFAIEPDLAGRHLEAMLRDRTPAHRCSALWVLESKQQPPACMSALADLAAADPVPEVRTRARRLARRLISAPSSSPATPAITTGDSAA